MTDNFDCKKKSDLNTEGQSMENIEKMRSWDTETDEIEDIETTTIFTLFKKTGVILRMDNALYLLWDQRYRNQVHSRENQEVEQGSFEKDNYLDRVAKTK